jgi:hypothetical protein
VARAAGGEDRLRPRRDDGGVWADSGGMAGPGETQEEHERCLRAWRMAIAYVMSPHLATRAPPLWDADGLGLGACRHPKGLS